MAQVVLPSALVGGPSSDDPELRRLHTELKEVNRKVLNNELDIPPESERSPSPEPVYDRNGIRLNTRSCTSFSATPLSSAYRPPSQTTRLLADGVHATTMRSCMPIGNMQ